MTDKEIVSTIREHYPKYNKYDHSHIKDTRYGIRPVDEAIRLVQEKFGELPPYLQISSKLTVEQRKKDSHKLRHKIYCRLSGEQFDLLQQHVNGLGISMQEYIFQKVSADIKRGEKC